MVDVKNSKNYCDYLNMNAMMLFCRMDLSFSLDENGNSIPFKVSPLPNATSTPQKIKKKITKQLICSVCGKTYQLQHYYNIHLQTHNTPDTSSTTPG